MPEGQRPPRAALYIDFDNVFMALLRWDERAAYAFGERPDAWLAWLEGRAEGGTELVRRTLVRRCYLNPGRYIDFPLNGPVARYRAERELRNRTYFSEFRAAFVQAGFDVVDCPPVASLKNAADMKMALDIREALDHKTVYEEFILLSGDSDFLPALVRLRAHDRRITILAQDTARAAYLAAADQVVGLEDFAHEGMGNLPVAQYGQLRAAPPALPARERSLPPPRMAEPPQRIAEPPRAVEPPRAQDPEALRRAALDWLRRRLAASPAGALRLTEVGQALTQAFPTLRTSAYAGAGTLGALIEEAGDRRLSLSGPPSRRWVFDADRGPPPGDLPPGVEEQPGLPVTPEPEPEAEPETVELPPSLAGRAPPAAPPVAEPAPRVPSAPPAAPAPPGTAEPPVMAEPPAAAEPPVTAEQPAAAAPPGAAEPSVMAEQPAAAGPSAPSPADDPERAMTGAALLVRDLLWGTRDTMGHAQDLPVLSTAEVGFVLEAVAARQPLEAAGSAATEIAAAAAARGLLVSPREVAAMLRWLARGHARLGEPAPAEDGALRLGRVLYATLLNALRAAAENLPATEQALLRISDAEKDALRAWTQSALGASSG